MSFQAAAAVRASSHMLQVQAGTSRPCLRRRRSPRVLTRICRYVRHAERGEVKGHIMFDSDSFWHTRECRCLARTSVYVTPARCGCHPTRQVRVQWQIGIVVGGSEVGRHCIEIVLLAETPSIVHTQLPCYKPIPYACDIRCSPAGSFVQRYPQMLKQVCAQR